MKNPVIEYFLQKGLSPDRVNPTGTGTLHVRRFHYLANTIGPTFNLEDLLSRFDDPNIDIFCDANVFAASRLALAQCLLSHRKVFVVPEVARELVDLRKRPTRAEGTKELLDLLFDQGSFRPSIEIFDLDSRLTPYQNAIEYYVNILHLRKTALEPFVRAFVKRHGREPRGRERAELYRHLPRSARAARLANKGDITRRFSDEVTVVAAVIHGIINRKDVVLLSFDADVFDQFYKFTSLLRDDYASYLLADDYISNPDSYGEKYSMVDYPDLAPLLSDRPSSFAVERPRNLDYLIPKQPTTRAIHVVAAEKNGSAIAWVGIEEMRDLISVKAATCGRNTTQHGDNNVYIILKPCIQKVQLPKKRHYAFFLNDRKLNGLATDSVSGKAKQIALSYADYMRALDDIETPEGASK